MPSRVLIIFPGALGDLMLLAPTIAAVAKQNRGAPIELMARYELAEFAVGRLGIARAHSIDRREVALLFREGGSDDEFIFFRAFDRIYCFFSSDDARFRERLIAACAPGEVTFHSFRSDAAGHAAAAYMKEVFGEARVETIKLSVPPSDLDAASRLIRGLIGDDKFVAIFPGSGSPKKNWPVEHYRALADGLKPKRVVFILGPAESSLRDELSATRHRIIKDQPLGIIAAIASMASAFVGNDSGVSHLAAATGTRGVVLFGPTEPRRWRPLGRVTVLQREPIDSIEVSDVLAVLQREIS
jgi:heptosyltransferase III